MASNIEITAQINQLLNEQNQLYIVQAKIQKGQLAIMQAMAEAMGNIDVSKLNDSMKSVTDQINAAEEAFNKLNENGQRAGTQVANEMSRAKLRTLELAEAAEKAAEKADRLAIATAAYEGASKGFQFSFNILTSIVGLLGTAAKGVGQFAMSVLRFPIGIWNFLFEKATSGGGGGELRQTLENIRKEFGDLNKNASAAIIGMAKSMQGTLAETGLSVYRTFGNLAERLKYVAELAKALGPIFTDVFQRGLIRSIEAVGAFQKGLGLSNEQMKTMARTSVITGNTMDETLRQTANQAIQLGEAFGMNAMEISRDMAEMEGDMKHFGGMSKSEFGAAAVYVKKLGLEIKSLTGIVDAFDNLDSAAQAVARLNQQLGIQLETLTLMKATGPERLEYIRKQFERTGQTFEQLDRQTQQYFATQIGLTQEEAALAFAQKNRGVGLDDIRKKAETAEKKQLTQAEAMKKLADSIERLVKSGSSGAKTLFGAFVEGFEQAIFRSREFRSIMRGIRQSLRITRMAGRQVGRAFIDMFPGVRDIMGGMAELFNPARWRKTMSKVVDVFKSFFIDMQTNPEAGLKNLFDRLKKVFFDHFDASSSAGRRLIDGFKTFFTVIIKAIVGALKTFIPIIFNAMTEIIKSINRILRGEELPIEANGIKGQIQSTLQDLWTAIKPSGTALWDAIKDLFSTVWTKIKGWLSEHSTQIALFFFGPAFVRALIGAGTTALVQGITKAITSKAATSAIGSAVSSVAQAGQAAAAAGRGAQAAGGLGGAIFTMEEMQIVMAQSRATTEASKAVDTVALKQLGLKLTVIAGAIAVGGVALALALRAMIAILGGVNPEDILLASGVLTVAVIGMVGLSFAAKQLSNVNPATVMKAMPAAAALGALALGMATVTGLIILAFQGAGITMEGALAAAAGMVAGAVIFASAAGIAFAAAGLATIVAGTLGLGVPAILAGVGFIAGIVVGMTGYIIQIINTLKNLDIGDNVEAFNAKIDAFVDIFKAIVAFAGVFSAIAVGGAIASITSVIQLLNPSGAIAAFFGIGPAGGGNPLDTLVQIITSISGTITELITQLSQMTFTEEQIKGLQVIGPVISAIAELATAIKVPPELGSGFFVDEAANLELVRTWFTKISEVIAGPNGLLKKAVEVVREISGVPVINPEATKTTAEILKNIVGLVGAIKMDPEYIKLLQESADQRNFSEIKSAALANITANVEGVISVIRAVKDYIPGILDSITAVSRKYTGLELKRAASGASIVGSAIEMVINLVQAVRTIGTKKTTTGTGENAQNIEMFDRATLDSVVAGMRSLINTVFAPGNSNLIKQIVEAIRASGVSGLERGIGEKVQSISTIISSLAQLGGTDIQDAFTRIGVIGTGGARINFSTITSILAGFSSSISAIQVSRNQINQIKNFGEAVSGVSTALQTIDTVFNAAAERAANFGTIRSAIFGTGETPGIVTRVNQLINDLNSIEPISINTGLRRLAGTMELGSSEEFTINHRNFTIQVNLAVRIDAETIERAIVSNPAGTLVVTRNDVAPPGTGRTRGRR